MTKQDSVANEPKASMIDDLTESQIETVLEWSDERLNRSIDLLMTEIRSMLAQSPIDTTVRGGYQRYVDNQAMIQARRERLDVLVVVQRVRQLERHLKPMTPVEIQTQLDLTLVTRQDFREAGEEARLSLPLINGVWKIMMWEFGHEAFLVPDQDQNHSYYAGPVFYRGLVEITQQPLLCNRAQNARNMGPRKWQVFLAVVDRLAITRGESSVTT